MSQQLLERPQNVFDPDDPIDDSPSDLRFRTINSDDVQRLNDLFTIISVLFPALLLVVPP
jgi:hypothetical protein